MKPYIKGGKKNRGPNNFSLELVVLREVPASVLGISFALTWAFKAVLISIFKS
jgi:hypothetical protein